MLHRVLTSSLLVVLLAALAASCGSRTTRNGGGNAATDDFCEDLASKLETCKLEVDFNVAECRQAIASADADALAGARACLEGACASVVACVNGELGPIVSPVAGSGGTGAGGGTSLDCPGSPVRCLDADTAQYCVATGSSESAVCADALAAQGIISNGCSSDGAGDGCTVDAFMDPDCEAGAPVFAVCQGLTEKDLVNTYVACFQNLSGASFVIPCYPDFVDATGTVDCTGAQIFCAVP